MTVARLGRRWAWWFSNGGDGVIKAVAVGRMEVVERTSSRDSSRLAIIDEF